MRWLRGRPGRVGLRRAGGAQQVDRPLRGQKRLALAAQRALDAGERADDDRRGARGAAEFVGVLAVEVAALQVAVAGGGDFAAPALGVDAAAVVGEAQPRPVGPVIGAVRARRRRAGPDDDRLRARVGGVERVAPAGRKAARAGVVERVVEVLRAVAGGLDHDDPAPDRVADRREIVRPPLDRDVAALVAARLEVEPRSGAMDLQQHDVAGAQVVGGGADRAGGRQGREGHGADVGVRRDADDAPAVVVAADLAEHGGAVVGARRVRPRDHPALVHAQVLVGEAPAPLEVDDPHPGAAAAAEAPGVAGVDAHRRRVEIALPGDEAGRHRRDRRGARLHVVDAERVGVGVGLVDHHRGLARRLDVGGLDEVVLDQLVRDRVEALLGRGDAVVAQILVGLGRAGRGLVAVAEERLQRGALGGQQPGERADVGSAFGAEPARAGPDRGLGPGHDDQLALAARLAVVFLCRWIG